MYRSLLPLDAVHLFSVSPRLCVASSLFLPPLIFFLFNFSSSPSLIRWKVRDCTHCRYSICVHDCHFHPEILFRLQVCAVYRSAFFVFFLPRYMAALLLVHAGWCVPLGREAFHVRMLVRSLSLLVHTIALLSTRYTSASSLHPPLRQLPRGGSSQVLPTPHPTRTSFCLSVSLRIYTDRCSRVSSSDTLRSPWLLPLREHSTWFLTRFFEFLRV